MKNVVRNNLWMMIVAWCLLLNGYSVLGALCCFLASLYLFTNTSKKNYWRLLCISLISFSFNYLLASVTIIGLFKHFTLFTILISINVALLNERMYQDRLSTLYGIFRFIFMSLIFFLAVALIMPAAYVIGGAKENLYALIIILFIPYTSEILISLLVKEYNKKRVLDRLNHLS